MKKGLVINCSPVKNGATAEIVKIISEELSLRYDVRSICKVKRKYGIHFY